MIVVNPRGGRRRGPAVWEQVRPVFEAVGSQLDVHVTTHTGHAAELAESADLDGCDGLCLVGGDGTIHEVVGGLMRRADPAAVPLGIIPAGTGNTVLEQLGCTDPLQAAQRIVAGHIQLLDVVRLTIGDHVSYCANIIGWGAAVEINRMAERLRVLGPARYTAAALLEILRVRRRHLQLTLDDQLIEDEFCLVVACNTKFTGKGMQLAPRAEIADGRVDVVFVRHATRWQMLQLFRTVFDGSHVDLPCVEYRQVASFGLHTERQDLLNCDGELAGHTPVSGEVVPAALRLFA